jgi:methionine synthase II (cobalamin-independent)
MQIQRTVIGSFPTPPSSISHEEAVRKAIDLQLKHVDIVSDGEPYGDMKDYALQNPGIEPAYMGIKFAHRIWNRDDPSKNMDPDECWKIQDHKRARFYLDKKGMKDVNIKIALTGPITLVYLGKCGAMFEGFGPYGRL